MVTKEVVLKWIGEIDELLSYAYDAYQKLEVINNRYGLNNLSKIIDIKDSDFQFFDNLQYLYFTSINNLVFGICNVYDTDSKATSFKSVLNAMLYDLKMKGHTKIDIDEELEGIRILTDKDTMHPIYNQLRTLRDKSIAHSDKTYSGQTINLSEVKKFLDETNSRANRIFHEFGEHVALFDFKYQCVKNPIDDFFDKYNK